MPCMPSGSTWPELDQHVPSGQPASPRDRQACYSARLRAAGLAQVAVWVPAGRAAHIHAEAARLRSEAGLLLPADCEPEQLSLSLVVAGPGAMR